MKKLFTIVIVCFCSLVFFGCGRITFKEYTLEQSQTLDLEAIQKAISENKAKAVDDYEGKIFNYTASVMDIDESYVMMSDVTNTQSLSIKVALKHEELSKLNKGDMITVVGKLSDINYWVLEGASVVETIPAEDNVSYLKETFKDDFESAKKLLNSKDKFTRLSGEEIKQIIPSGWIIQRRYFKTENGDYATVAEYTGIVRLNADGTGQYELKGKEAVDWSVDGDNLYYEVKTGKGNKDDKKYEVYRLDDETLICYGNRDVFLLISNMLLK